MGADDYDFEDAFIDDSEFIDMIEHSDRRKPKFGGFFIAKGSIDRSEELVEGAAGLDPGPKPPRKRKPGAESGSDFEKVRAAPLLLGGERGRRQREQGRRRS
jgi:hypothetical protein